MESIQEAESAQALPASVISQADIDAELRRGTGYQNGKMRVFTMYQQEITAKDAIQALKKEYGTSGHSHTFLDGTSGFVDYSPSGGMKLHRYQPRAEVKLTWTKIEKRIRQMIQEGSYLTPEELEKYQRDHLETPPETEPAPDHAPDAVPPMSPAAPQREVTQADIDAALQEWNGDIASKRRVQQYMENHAREKGTAEWLKNEYGEDYPAYPVHGHNGGAGTDLSWTKVQRHLARLVKEDRFFTPEELDNFSDIDPAAVREHLESGEPNPFVEQVEADVERIAATRDAPAPEQDAPAPTVRETYERYKPVVKDLVMADTAYQNACKNSDKDIALLEGNAAVERAALTITSPEFMRLYFDMPGFRNRLHREILDETYPILSQPQQEQAVPDFSDQPVTREGDTISIGTGDTTHEVDITISDGDWQEIQSAIPDTAAQPPRDPLAPAYKPGDTVYLDNTAFEITGIGLFDVELRDPTLPIPLMRTESKENFERLLRRDPRNEHITGYLPADLSRVNDDFREVLTAHLLTDRDKDYISGWLRSGENNRGIAQRLSLAFANRAETVTLKSGDIADYFTSTISMAVEIQDKFGTKLELSWEATPRIPPCRNIWRRGAPTRWEHGAIGQQAAPDIYQCITATSIGLIKRIDWHLLMCYNWFQSSLTNRKLSNSLKYFSMQQKVREYKLK